MTIKSNHRHYFKKTAIIGLENDGKLMDGQIWYMCKCGKEKVELIIDNKRTRATS